MRGSCPAQIVAFVPRAGYGSPTGHPCVVKVGIKNIRITFFATTCRLHTLTEGQMEQGGEFF